jgi:DNA topoisomerase-3
LIPFSKHNEWSGYVNFDLLTSPLKGKDAGDHSPITPMVATYSSEFHDSDAAKLYNFIVRHFISTVRQTQWVLNVLRIMDDVNSFSECSLFLKVTADCLFTETKLRFNINGEEFTFTGKKMVRAGFVDVYPFSVFPSDDIIPEVIRGEKYPIIEVRN